MATAAPRRAVGVVLVILVASGLAAWLWHGLLPALGVAFALLNAVAEFLFPIQYRLTPVGAEMRCFLSRRAIAWSAVRRILRHPDGVKLSPLERPSRRDPFRGLFLHFAGNQAQVMERVLSAGCRGMGPGPCRGLRRRTP
jgi:hypothetical protein